eukprot:1633835-Amphidinium_carterae.1
MAWAHEQGGIALRAVAAVRAEADQERQRALYTQSEQFLDQYRNCMQAQEQAAEMIGRLCTEMTSGEAALQQEQKVNADLRSELLAASNARDTVRGELDSQRRQLERAVTQRDEVLSNNARGNAEYQRLQSELQEAQRTRSAMQQEAIRDREAMLFELAVRDEALAKASVEVEHASAGAESQNMGLGTGPNFHDSSVQALGLGSEPSFAQLPVVSNSIACACACAEPSTARLPSSCVAQSPLTQTHTPSENTCPGVGSRFVGGEDPYTRLFRGAPGLCSGSAVPGAGPSVMSSASGSGVHAIPSSYCGNVSWYLPSRAEHVGASAGIEQDIEIRKDRNRLPELDLSGSASDPVQLLHSFEIWLLKCSTAISTWSRSPKDAISAWSTVLENATKNWTRWSTSTPTERKLESLQRPVSGRFVDTVSSTFEAILRSDLIDRVPKSVVEKIYSEQRISSSEVLEELMKVVLPPFHTVRITLLDSVESVANRCSTYVQLQASLRVWSRGVRISMSHYGLSPEPRRLWLSLLSRMTSLQSDPMFAAILDRHMVSTGVRTVQTLESVLSFVVALEAEIEAIIQDQVPHSASSGHSKNTPKANASTVGSEQRSTPSKPSDAKSSKPGTPELCKSWNTDKGCRFGKSCKYKHPYAKVADGLCFVCGAKEHNSKNCPNSTSKPGSAPKGGTPGGKDGGKGKAPSGQDKPRSSSGSNNRPKGGSGNRSQSGGKAGGNNNRNSSGDKRGKDAKGPAAKSAEVDDKGQKDKPSTPRASNPARALSAALDCSSSSEGLLDSGASHVIAPLEELPESQKGDGQRVALTLASGRPTDSIILEGEVFAQRVRRVLIPFGKLIRQTGLVSVWSRAGLMLMAVDGAGQLRLVCKPTMRQGGMPHIPTEVVHGFREALRETRKESRLYSFEDWERVLGNSIPICETRFSVQEDEVDVHGKSCNDPQEPIARRVSVLHEESCDDPPEPIARRVSVLAESSSEVTVENRLTDVLERLTSRAEKLTDSLNACVARSEPLQVVATSVSEDKTDCSQQSSAQDVCAPVEIAYAAAENMQKARREVSSRLEAYLLEHGVPTTASRTNLGMGKRVRSLLLGLYTRRGIGVTNKTRSFPLLEELHSLARTCAVPLSYTSITINVVSEASVEEHRDSNNVGTSAVFVCGPYTSGEFVQGSTTLSVHDGWFKFYGQVPHLVRHVTGTRISVVYFTPVGFRNISKALQCDLRSLGFPIDRVMAETVPVMLQGRSACCKDVSAFVASSSKDEETHKPVLIEYACYDDSLLSASFELAGGISHRLGLPRIDLVTGEGKKEFERLVVVASIPLKGKKMKSITLRRK